MHTADKLDILATGARYDLSCACGGGQARTRGEGGRWLYPSAVPQGGRVPLLKVLLSNNCSRDCYFCAQASGRDFTRAAFSPSELAHAFMDLHRRQQAWGLFLSSAIDGSAVDSMERMLDAAELLRQLHGYRGWLHLKILPGSTREQVERAMRLATRVSINMEAPGPARLGEISPHKRFHHHILKTMRWVRAGIKDQNFRCRGQTTQFVVGAGGESDGELIDAMGSLYRDLNLSRIYFSAFQPISGTPLEGREPTDFLREHRLYQADFLLRKYGFEAEELVTDEDGNLPRKNDPKSVWAAHNQDRFPIEINTASERELLRVPGIGPVTAARVMEARLGERLISLDHLKRLGINVAGVEPYLLLGGRRISARKGAQLRLAV